MALPRFLKLRVLFRNCCSQCPEIPKVTVGQSRRHQEDNFPVCSGTFSN